MSLPSKTDLQTLDITWRGLPFCWIEATPLNTQSLDITWRGLPFVAAADTAVVEEVVPSARLWPQQLRKRRRLMPEQKLIPQESEDKQEAQTFETLYVETLKRDIEQVKEEADRRRAEIDKAKRQLAATKANKQSVIAAEMAVQAATEALFEVTLLRDELEQEMLDMDMAYIMLIVIGM
jgi:hypothetical protein